MLPELIPLTRKNIMAEAIRFIEQFIKEALVETFPPDNDDDDSINLEKVFNDKEESATSVKRTTQPQKKKKDLAGKESSKAKKKKKKSKKKTKKKKMVLVQDNQAKVLEIALSVKEQTTRRDKRPSTGESPPQKPKRCGKNHKKAVSKATAEANIVQTKKSRKKETPRLFHKQKSDGDVAYLHNSVNERSATETTLEMSMSSLGLSF